MPILWNKKQKKTGTPPNPPIERDVSGIKVTCSKCKREYTGNDVWYQYYVCPECGNYMPIGAKERLVMLVDDGTFEHWFEEVGICDPLETPGYPEKLAAAQEKSGSTEAVTIGLGTIGGHETVIGVCDPNFMIGSMGHAMGERITLAFERATERNLPVILFSCSGGARMQEGIISLMQMEKTAAAVKRHSDAGLFYCCVLTDPTMGGVTASFATLADVIAELNVIERIIPEFGGARAETVDRIAPVMQNAIGDFQKRYERMSPEDIVQNRYDRFRKF